MLCFYWSLVFLLVIQAHYILFRPRQTKLYLEVTVICFLNLDKLAILWTPELAIAASLEEILWTAKKTNISAIL